MDLLSLMHQRVADQNVEVRRARLNSAGLCAAALVSSIVAALLAPCAVPAEDRVSGGDGASFISWVRVLTYVALVVASYAMMARAADALTSGRSLLLPPYSGGGGVGGGGGAAGGTSSGSSPLFLPRLERSRLGLRSLLVLSVYVTVGASLLVGPSYAPWGLLVAILAAQWALFLAYMVSVFRLLQSVR